MATTNPVTGWTALQQPAALTLTTPHEAAFAMLTGKQVRIESWVNGRKVGVTGIIQGMEKESSNMDAFGVFYNWILTIGTDVSGKWIEDRHYVRLTQ